MELREVFEAAGCDWEDAKSRISSDALLTKFLIQFLSDTSFSSLEKAVGEGSFQEAFCAVHSLKGVASNLGLKNLELSAGEFSNYLREKRGSHIDVKICDELFNKVSADYRQAVNAIEWLKRQG